MARVDGSGWRRTRRSPSNRGRRSFSRRSWSSPSRPPRDLPAPQIAGHRHLRLLSDAGGYGDVHLYEEIALGGRKVAVKVIREDDPASPAARQFLAEANTMAAPEHPNIVRVYGSGTTADGRPYISMQYCAGDTFEQRVLHERLSLAEVLRTGVGVGSAVETAHRAGLLHRDIKPANILKTPWGSPGLTDFGVAHQMSAEEVSEDVGVSVPWSPPEMLDTSTNGPRLRTSLLGRHPLAPPGRTAALHGAPVVTTEPSRR
ncbi:MAG: serine/threonine protein kinase [Tetrasphaera sp.]|nr:serine/threonine protein kinase [Tetrasphaera sp.]